MPDETAVGDVADGAPVIGTDEQAVLADEA
jgi:hypothetical protein